MFEKNKIQNMNYQKGRFAWWVWYGTIYVFCLSTEYATPNSIKSGDAKDLKIGHKTYIEAKHNRAFLRVTNE